MPGLFPASQGASQDCARRGSVTSESPLPSRSHSCPDMSGPQMTGVGALSTLFGNCCPQTLGAQPGGRGAGRSGPGIQARCNRHVEQFLRGCSLPRARFPHPGVQMSTDAVPLTVYAAGSNLLALRSLCLSRALFPAMLGPRSGRHSFQAYSPRHCGASGLGEGRGQASWGGPGRAELGQFGFWGGVPGVVSKHRVGNQACCGGVSSTRRQLAWNLEACGLPAWLVTAALDSWDPALIPGVPRPGDPSGGQRLSASCSQLGRGQAAPLGS